MEEKSKNGEISLTSYVLGFVLSLILTISAFVPVMIHVSSKYVVFSQEELIPAVLGIAIVQLLVQLIFFMHLFKEKRPRWNLIIFASTVSIIFIIVLGSIWIMDHLNYNMMPKDVYNYINQQEGF